MLIQRSLAALLCVALGAPAYAQANPSHTRLGHYKLTIGKYAEGEINIRSVQSDSATFDLNYWQCASQCQNKDRNFWFVNNGVIEGGSISLTGSTGKYVSDNSEDKDLGHCVLHFKLNKRAISVQQSGRCWWFGEGINVSGTYRLQPTEAVRQRGR